MNKVKIICDSTCDIQEDLIKELDIDIAPLTVNFSNGESYRDTVDISTKDLYKRIEQLNELPHTAALVPGEFMKLFDKYIEEGYDIVYTGISSKMSTSYNTACLIAQDYDEGRIHIVDSKNLSTGIALVLIKGVDARNEGKSAKEVADIMRDTANRVMSQFVIDKFDHLHKGGRCSGVERFLGTVLKIHPVIEVRDGAMSVGAKPRGKMEVACDKLLEMLEAEGNNVDPEMIFVTHSEADELAKYLLPKVKEMHPEATVKETYAGCVVSTHCGKNTIGILWINKQ